MDDPLPLRKHAGLAAGSIDLRTLLQSTRPFAMARYQRHYEWSRKEMEALLTDLFEKFEQAGTAQSAAVFHFLGNLILCDDDVRALQVVDGQQRLISLSLLLAAARDRIRDPATKDAIDALLFLPGASREPRVQPGRGDDAFFVQHVLPRGQSAKLRNARKQAVTSAERMRENSTRAHRWLDDLDEHGRVAFVHFIVDHCFFVRILVDDEANAFSIFETTNNRGRPLSTADILRYALVEFASQSAADPAREQGRLLDAWDRLENELGREGLESFLAQWRARVLSGRAPNRPLHRDILASFKSPEDARVFLTERMLSDIAAFHEIYAADAMIADEAIKRQVDAVLWSLLLLDFDDWKPLAQLTLERLRGDGPALLTDLRLIERLAWFFYLKNDDKGIKKDRARRFGQVQRFLIDGGRVADCTRASLTAPEKMRLKALLEGRIEPKWIPLRSLLVRIELALSRGDIRHERAHVTIEHVLPRNPRQGSGGWRKEFDTDEAIEDYANRLGNLCLVPSEVNRRLGNRTFAAKQRLVQDEHLAVRFHTLRDVAQKPAWTRDVIKRRSRWLRRIVFEALNLVDEEDPG